MLWKNGQDVDSLMLASICVYCSENLSDLRERRKGGREAADRRGGRNTGMERGETKERRAEKRKGGRKNRKETPV